jgi:hypothetical protein
MSAWYLFQIISGVYIETASQDACERAARAMRDPVICRQAVKWTACPVKGSPSMSEACPVFAPLALPVIQNPEEKN